MEYTPPPLLPPIRAGDVRFDLAVTGYNMPGTSGIAVAWEPRSLHRDMPVAMVSGYLTDDLSAKALSAGVCELIYKPNTADELCNAVARIVGN